MSSCALAGPLVAQPGLWGGRAELPAPRRLLAAAEHDGRIYTFGGCGSPCFAPPLHTSTFEERLVEVYDPRLDPRLDPHLDPHSAAWSRGRPMPTIVFGAAAAAPGDGFIYLFGGFVTAASTQAYDPRADTWQAKPAMPTPRHGLAAAAWDGKVYVVGGSNGSAPLAALEAYDPGSNSWEQLPPMPTARVFLAAAAVDGKVYAIGGSPDCCGNGTTDVVEIYDTVRRTWSRGPSLRLAMQTSAAAASGGKVYVLGGFVPGQGAKGATFELDPADVAAGWVPQAAMPTARDQAPAVAVDDVIHVLGGSTSCHCSPRGDHPTFQPAVADLEIDKTDDRIEVCPGETMTYRITVHNRGPSGVHRAQVVDPLPELAARFAALLPGATWTCAPSADSPPGASCRQGGPHPMPIDDEEVDLPVDGEVIYEVTGTLALSAGGTLANRARVIPPTDVTDSNLGNNLSSATEVDVIRRDRLEIHKRELPARDVAAPLDVLLYEITVTNHCHIPLLTTVEDDLSAAGLADPFRWCRGTCASPSTAGNLHDVVTLPPGGSATYRASGTVPCDCTAPRPDIDNVAFASAPGQDRQHDDDVDTIRPSAAAALAVDVVGPGLLAGCSGDYTITVSNAGPCAAPNVVLEIAPPPGLDLVSLSAPCVGGSPCALGDLPTGPSPVVVTARLAVAAGLQCPAGPPRPIRAKARSTCGQAEDVVAAGIPCDLAIAKTDGLVTAAPGDCILYSIDVTNPGCGAVAGALVTDAFPAKLDFVSWCRGATCTPLIAGDLTDTLDLPRGGSETYRVAATVSPTFAGTLRNTASVALPAGVPDSQPADNASADTSEVVPLPAVTALCTGIEGQVFEGSAVTFTFVLWNGGPAAQGDNPGDEFLDVLPVGLTLAGAVASSGTISTVANTVHWNGAIPVGGLVTIDVSATVDMGTAGTTICNPATVFFDADGDGVNESSAPSDDRCHPCCVTPLPQPPIPTLSHLALAGLGLLLAALALARLRGSSA